MCLLTPLPVTKMAGVEATKMEELLDIALSYGVRIQFTAIFSPMSKVGNVITVIFNGLWL